MIPFQTQPQPTLRLGLLIMGTVPLITCKNYGAAKNPGVIIGTVPVITRLAC